MQQLRADLLKAPNIRQSPGCTSTAGAHAVLPAAWGRALLLALLLVGLALLSSSETFQSFLRRILDATAPIISEHPFWGAVLFILVSALSAMVAFFSSTLRRRKPSARSMPSSAMRSGPLESPPALAGGDRT